MNVVYVVGSGSKWNNNELRFSLRSLDRFAVGLDKVFIIGECPDFIDKSQITHVYVPDSYSAAHHNVYMKVKAAINHPATGNEFLLSSDDHFLMQTTDLNERYLFYKGEDMPTFNSLGKSDIGSDSYIRTLINTAEVLSWYHIPTKFYEGHANKLICKDTWHFLDKIGFWEQMFRTEDGMTIGTPMAAATAFLNPNIVQRHRPDIKIRTWNETDQSTVLHCQSFSIADAAIRCGIDAFLEQFFSEPSRFEKK